MSAISIICASFCNEKKIIGRLCSELGYNLIEDSDLILNASKLSKISTKRIEGVIRGETSVFNRFSHEKDRVMTALKVSLAAIPDEENVIINGLIGQLVPRYISHVLTVCWTAEKSFRIKNALDQGLKEKEALKDIETTDLILATWMKENLNISDPWDPTIYDMLIPANKTDEDQVIKMIKESKDLLRKTKQSEQAMDDFRHASFIEWELVKEGHFVDVKSQSGIITITINKNVLMLNKLEEELKSITQKLDGVKTVETKVGKGFHQSDIYMSFNFEMPGKVLLVDDERDFVQTLSERLLMRDMGSVVAYDGESALDIIEQEEPEVIILDLRMPGIDGIEVLKKLKASGKKTEVIILTGHGSEKDEETCMKLGAFAYLQKPVNIEVLSKTMKEAYKKLNSRKDTE